MPLRRSDYDQAVRYLQHARTLLEGLPGGRMRAIRDVLDLAIRRLSPGDFYAGDSAAEITLLRDFAGKVTGDARTDILKAVAILTDRSRWGTKVNFALDTQFIDTPTASECISLASWPLMGRRPVMLGFAKSRPPTWGIYAKRNSS
jgi:hypothetical protein